MLRNRIHCSLFYLGSLIREPPYWPLLWGRLVQLFSKDMDTLPPDLLSDEPVLITVSSKSEPRPWFNNPGDSEQTGAADVASQVAKCSTGPPCTAVETAQDNGCSDT